MCMCCFSQFWLLLAGVQAQLYTALSFAKQSMFSEQNKTKRGEKGGKAGEATYFEGFGVEKPSINS